MIRDQLESRGINDPEILKVFQSTPRHIFVPHVSLYDAYSDQPLAIKAGQTISQPYIVARMLEYLKLSKNNEILEIGSGSGYATALLSKLCRHVDALEVYGDLVQASRFVLNRLDIINVNVMHRSAWEQLDSQKVYDRIILWASPPKIPDHLFDNLSEEGILVAPEGKSDQYVWVFKKQAGKITKERKEPVRFVPLVQGTVSEIDNNSEG
ncbi:MAG: protein-L-isoaspartate(D-aspartate) O-methyltransferase [Candidatus Marinimicrobia bacterium]|nr:protein-L-isoaspartate(D-aspartate) O-methyltransferase [Candidatus Neomarinimicrobiota bacterium]